MLNFDLPSFISSFALFFLVFSPLIFSEQKNEKDYIGWKGIFKSKWFGVSFIFLLSYSYFIYLNFVSAILFSIVVSVILSFLVNWRLLVKK